MRFFSTFPEALNELKRELKEMGLRVHTKSVQNKDITDNSSYDSMEIQNYTYTVLNPDISLIPLANLQWCQEEFAERISMKHLNPGEAWHLRAKYWTEFFSKRKPGKFDYTYPDRLADQIARLISLLRKDIMTRRAFLPVFDP